jgi:hypothetical protein
MKDLVREYWKIAAAFAAGAFLLSFLVGLVTRNPFGVVILRALLLTVIFAALGAGIRFVTRKYLPELVSGGADVPNRGERPDEAGTRGTKIDITLPEERPEAARRVRSRESASGAPVAAEGGRETEGEEDIVQRAEAEALDDLAEELAEELPAASDSGQAEKGEPGDAGQEEGEAEELQPLGREKGRGGQKPSAGTSEASDEDGDMDSLPDISNLEVAGEQGSGSPQDRSGRAETPQDSMRGAVSGQDPATIARAIRTVLKRDEKG